MCGLETALNYAAFGFAQEFEARSEGFDRIRFLTDCKVTGYGKDGV